MVVSSHCNSFPVDEQMNMKSVVEYFQEMYGFTIRYSHLPCLQVGNQRKVNYLPMEVGSHSTFLNLLDDENLWCLYLFIFLYLSSQACKIIEGQRYTKGLTDKQITSLLKVTCQRPRDRETDILQVSFSNLLSHFPLFKLRK